MARKKANEVAVPETVVPPKAAAPDDSVFYLPATLSIQTIAQSAASLRERLARPGALTVDLSRVLNVDTAGIQTLLAFCNEAPQRGLTLEIRGQSAALTQALAGLGLQGQIPAASSHATQ